MTFQINGAQIIAIAILIVSGLWAFKGSKKINYRTFHNVVAGSLLIIVIFGIPIHLQRFTTKGPYNWISWIHIIIFSFLIYISILAFKKWNQPHEHYESKEFLVNYKGNQYDISSFVPQHPGGSVIKKAKDKDLETIWKEHGVSWHNDNPRVQQKLAELIKLKK
ncbi:MAG: cytochrome b5 domain-containing protein [Pseudomonadota bacterium]|nr:cytochrome b5 domain-containing protein [Pseudomonadota bacterium]